jgi:crotonobetainyl-CoA:carnitine CoA-transferase CaiB-like acyl-CoA transferase
MGCYECREGWLGITVLTPDQWRNWCDLIGRRDLAEEPRYLTSPSASKPPRNWRRSTCRS